MIKNVKRSDLHYSMIALMKQAFPFERILSSVTVKIENKVMEFDAYLVNMNCYVEFQGQQHYQVVPFFNKNKQGLRDQKYRDQEKFLYCQRNGYGYAEIPYWHEKDAQKVRDTILTSINQGANNVGN